jgi:glycosyltransferase involved in cell wall biosynthesis
MAQVVFAMGLQQRGIPLTLLSLKSTETPLVGQLRDLGVRVKMLPGWGMTDAVRLWRIIEFLRRERFSVLQTHLTYANVIGTLAGRIVGLPVVATLHSDRPDTIGNSLQRLRNELEHWTLCTLAHRVLAVSYAAAEAYRARLGGRHIDVIPNSVAPVPPLAASERAALRAALVGDANRPLLIGIGRLTKEKAFDVLIDAFAQVRATHTDAALLIAGDGPQRAELEAQIARLGLQEHAFLAGHRSDIPQLLRAADLFVSASVREGLQRSLLEAMAAGTPVVVTDAGDAPRVVVQGTGFVVPINDLAALTARIKELLANPAQRQAFGQAAEQHIQTNYGVTQWVEQHLTLFEELQAKGPTNRQEVLR